MMFFVLEHPKDPVDDALTDFLPAPGWKRGEAPRCPSCGGFIGMIPELPPIRVELETWGRRFGDLVFGVGNDVLVSERFKDAFLSSGLTGFSGFLPAGHKSHRSTRKGAGFHAQLLYGGAGQKPGRG